MPNPAPVELKPVSTVAEMLTALQKHEQNTTYEADEVKNYVYERDSEFGSLNKGTLKLVLTQVSLKHLCRFIGVPNSVFLAASPQLANEMLKEFLLKKKDDEKARKFALKKSGGKTILRGLLPVDYSDIRNSDMLRPFEALEAKVVVQQANWMDEVDAPYVRTRFIFKETLKNVDGDDLYLGLDVASSELAAGPASAAITLFRLVCKNGAIGTYDERPYFFYDYRGALSVDMQIVMKTVTERMESDSVLFWERAHSAMQLTLNKQQALELLERLQSQGVLNKGISIKVQRQLEKNPPKTKWDFVNTLSDQAKGYRDELSLRYEMAAGRETGLLFSRRQDDPVWLVTTKQVQKSVAAKPVGVTP